MRTFGVALVLEVARPGCARSCCGASEGPALLWPIWRCGAIYSGDPVVCQRAGECLPLFSLQRRLQCVAHGGNFFFA
eukprot:9428556-Alexandrium_andersonii.AAC.1